MCININEILSNNILSLLAFIVSIVAIFISVLQYKTNKNKLKLDLFEKRIKFFYEFKKAKMIIQGSAQISYSEVISFRDNTAEIKYFFDKDIVEFRNEFHTLIDKKASLINTINQGKNEFVEESSKVSDKIDFLYEKNMKKFDKYFHFKKNL